MSPYDPPASGSAAKTGWRQGRRRSGLTAICLVFSIAALDLPLSSCREDRQQVAVVPRPPAASRSEVRHETPAGKPPELRELTAAARQFSGAVEGKKHNSYLLYQLFKRARAADLAAVLDSLELDDPENRELLSVVFLSLSGKDSALFLKYAARLDPTSFLLRGSFVAPLLTTDRKAVIGWLANDPHETAAARVLRDQLLAQLASVDPGAALPLLKELTEKEPPRERELSPADRTLIEKLSAEEIAQLVDQFDLSTESGDPFLADALRWLAAKKPAIFCNYALKVNTWAIPEAAGIAVKLDPAAVRDWLTTAQLTESDPTYGPIVRLQHILEALTGADRRAEIELAGKSAGLLPAVVPQIYGQWAVKEPEAALKHARLNQELPGYLLPSCEAMIVGMAATIDPSEAMRLANLPGSQVDAKAYAGVFTALLKDASYEAVDSLATTSPERVQRILEQPQMIEQISGMKPQALVGAMSGVLFIESNLPLFERAVVSLDASTHPEMAGELIGSLPDGPAKQKLAASLHP